MQAISEAVRPSGSHGTSGLYCSIVMPVASKPVSGGKLVEGFEAWARELRSQGQLTAELITQVRSMMENAGKGALDSILLPARVSTVVSAAPSPLCAADLQSLSALVG